MARHPYLAKMRQRKKAESPPSPKGQVEGSARGPSQERDFSKREIRAWCREVLGTKREPKTISPATKQAYEKCIERMESANQNPLTYCRARELSQQAYFLHRAAYVRYKAAGANGLLRAMDKAEKAGDRATVKALRAKLKQAAGDLYRAKGAKYERALDRQLSKRKSLRGKPVTWQDSVLGEMAPEYQDCTLVAMATGARPIEIKHGVKLATHEGQLYARIEGAKLGKGKGQEWRVLQIAPDAPLTQLLYQRVLTAGGRLEVGLPGSRAAFRDRFRRAAKRALGEKGIGLSPYSCRHQMAAELKAENVDPEIIAKVMGHQSSRSQKHYGHHGQGRGRVRVLEAEAAHEVRVHEQTQEHGHGPRR